MDVVWLAHGPYGWSLAAYVLTCMLSGVIIGAVGPGGVLLAPALLLLDVPIDVAGAAIVTSFGLGGVVTVLTQWRH